MSACLCCIESDDLENLLKQQFKDQYHKPLINNNQTEEIELANHQEMKKEEETDLAGELENVQNNHTVAAYSGGAVGGAIGGGAAAGITASVATIGSASAPAVAGGAAAATVVTISTGGFIVIVAAGILAVGGIGAGITYGVSKYLEDKKKEEFKTAVNAELERLGEDEKSQQDMKQKLLNDMRETKRNMERLDNLIKQQAIENGFTYDKSQNIIVMIGKTGHGKSTLGNRICGDVSKQGKEGPFEVSARKDRSCTTKVNVHHSMEEETKYVEGQGPPLIVDTPGWGDVDCKNIERNENVVVAALKGCGGINGFVLVISDCDRIDQCVQQMLKDYQSLLGVEFWKHLVIVFTKVDDDDDLAQFREANNAAHTQRILKEKLNVNSDIPVIPIGKKIFTKQLSRIMEAIPKDKFNCEVLKTKEEKEYDKYDEEYEQQQIQLVGINSVLDKIKNDIAKKKEILQKLDGEVMVYEK